MPRRAGALGRRVGSPAVAEHAPAKVSCTRKGREWFDQPGPDWTLVLHGGSGVPYECQVACMFTSYACEYRSFGPAGPRAGAGDKAHGREAAPAQFCSSSRSEAHLGGQLNSAFWVRIRRQAFLPVYLPSLSSLLSRASPVPEDVNSRMPPPMRKCAKSPMGIRPAGFVVRTIAKSWSGSGLSRFWDFQDVPKSAHPLIRRILIQKNRGRQTLQSSWVCHCSMMETSLRCAKLEGHLGGDARRGSRLKLHDAEASVGTQLDHQGPGEPWRQDRGAAGYPGGRAG